MSTELFDARGNPVLPRVITHWGDGAAALTNRDISLDLKVLSDVNQGSWGYGGAAKNGLAVLAQVFGQTEVPDYRGAKLKVTLDDGESNDAYALHVKGYSLLYDGSAWNRRRNSLASTVLASAERGATTNSADQTNWPHGSSR